MDDIDRFLAEDIRTGDITTETFVPDVPGRAVILCEDETVLAGLEEAVEVFGRLGAVAKALAEDGARVPGGTVVMEIEGSERAITTAERTALNIMMRMSGIATMVDRATMRLRERNDHVMVAGTRKTTPGFRRFEKKAIALGGGDPHRYGLDDLVLIKDNHIEAAGGIENIMERCLDLPYDMKVEVEVENMRDAEIAAKCGADIIMLDNRTPEEALALYKRIKEIDPGIMVEVSGRVTMDTIADYAECADRISMGCITHSVISSHFSLRLIRSDDSTEQ